MFYCSPHILATGPVAITAGVAAFLPQQKDAALHQVLEQLNRILPNPNYTVTPADFAWQTLNC